MELLDTEISCGVKQLCGVSDTPPEMVLKQGFRVPWHYYRALKIKKGDLKFAMVIFSDRVTASKNKPRKRASGAALAKFITENKLGKIIASDVVINPNSRNKICTWVWQIDQAAFCRWYNKTPEPTKEQLDEYYDDPYMEY